MQSTVKYTTPLPRISLSESLYTNFEICEGKNNKHLKNMLIYKANQFMLTKKNFKKSVHLLEDCVSGAHIDILNT